MIDFYELLESAVINNSNLKAGSFICCKDSKNVYMVPTTGGVPVKMADTILLVTDSARQQLLTPVDGKFYFCTDTKKLWAYSEDWVCINDVSTTEFSLDVTIPSTGSVTVTDSRITAESTGTFMPDDSVSDLISDVSVTCTSGSATVSGTCSYPIMGILRIK